MPSLTKPTMLALLTAAGGVTSSKAGTAIGAVLPAATVSDLNTVVSPAYCALST